MTTIAQKYDEALLNAALDSMMLEETEKSWKELKSEQDAIIRQKLKGRIVKPEIIKSGRPFRTTDGKMYYTDKDGSRRLLKRIIA